jgi:hypothetical protein
MLNNNKLYYNALRKWWYLPFLIYLLPNVLMSLFVVLFDLLIVDDFPVQLTAENFTIFLASLLVVFVFIYIKHISQFFNKRAFCYEDKNPSELIGKLIFILQFIDLSTLFLFDFGRVGGTSNSTNILALLVSYTSSDILFLLYYGHYRKKGIPYLNLVMYLIINVLKGWTGIWLILFFIEIYFQMTKKPLREIMKIVFVSLVILFSLYPVVNKYKYLIRGGVDYEPSTLLESAAKLAIRLQYTTNVILIAQESENLKIGLKNESILPYYFDNKLSNRFKSPNSINLQKYLTINYLIDKNQFSLFKDFEELGWYTGVGIVGWLFVLDPGELILYFIFISILISTPFILNHFFLKVKGLIPVIQTLSFSYVFHGWFAVHISFIFGLVLYIIINNIFKRKNTQVRIY